MLIAYPTDQGIALLAPSFSAGLSARDVAEKDVPEGVPFRLIPPEEVPASAEYREAWTVDFSEPDGVGLGYDAWRAARGLVEPD
jgi:hypothetical protein